MGILRFFALVSIFSAGLYSGIEVRAGQTGFSPTSNYVVIGAFAVHQNAVNFTNYAMNRSYDAHFEMNRTRNLYYVYVLSTEDRRRAVSEALRLREETEFSDAWVFGGALGANEPGEDISPVNEAPIEEVNAAASPAMPEEKKPSATVAVKENEDDLNGKKFLFNLYRASDGAEVKGEVNVIDVDRSRKMGTYRGNEPVRIPAPGSNSDDISFVCEVFGYRKMQVNLNYDDPTAIEGISEDIEGNITVVPFELVRLRKGDIAVMYNVFFYKDAGVMRPESQYEVNSLLEMLKENPNYKIMLHGHTNGSAPGKIISMGESKNFFSLTDTKEGFGTAKQLSEERAGVIRDYLIAEGVDPKRMELKAWGGKRPIHDKMSNRAGENVRVEVEILEE